MTTSNTGRFVWHELHTTDRPKAQKFYATLIGWETKEVPMGPGEPYTLCLLGGKDHAGITKSMAPAHVPPHWLPYLAVDSVDASAAKVKDRNEALRRIASAKTQVQVTVERHGNVFTRTLVL